MGWADLYIEKDKQAKEQLNMMSQASVMTDSEKKRRQQAQQIMDIVTSQPTTNKTVGENLFLTNVLPIKEQDSIAKKVGKGAVNFGASVLAAPGEVLRKGSINLGSLVSGKGLPSIPKNTSFTQDILPTSISAPINAYSDKHPFLGGLLEMGLDMGADPTTYLGMGGGKSLLLPKDNINKMIQTPTIPPKITPQTVDDVVRDNIWDEVAMSQEPSTYDGILPDPQSKIIMTKPKEPIDFKASLKNFYTNVVNNQERFSDVAKATNSDIDKVAMNTKSAGGVVDHNLVSKLVDKEGNVVGDALQTKIQAIPKGQEEKFWEYMSQRHNINRAAEGKPVQANYTPEMSMQVVEDFEEAHPAWRQIGDEIVNWIDDFMQTWGVNTGIVNRDLYGQLRQTYPNYFPTQRDFSTLENAIPDGLSQKFADLNTPIKKATGSSRDIRNPVENIMNLVNRTVRTAKYNEVGQKLLSQVRNNPEKTSRFAEIYTGDKNVAKTLDNIITVLEDGKPIYLKINDQALLDAMHGLPKAINNVKYVSALTQGIKNLITQYNPLFAVRNLVRDIPTAYVYGSEVNPLKFGKDLLGAGKDIVTNSPRFQRYQALGGGGANFFNQGDVAKSAVELMGNGNKLKDIALSPIHAIGKFNNLIESAPRIAEFNRVLDKTGDVTQALHASGEVTVNFARGGNITKSIDKAGGMYVNASVQGLDRFVRSFKNPRTAALTLAKAGIAVSTPDIALYFINKDNPYYQQLDNRNKDTYFCIPNMADVDEKGNAKTFFKLPKSRELGVLFGALFDRVMRAYNGEADSFKGFGNTVATNFAPANPLESSLYTPLYNLARNKDFADRAIVPLSMELDKRSKYLQYDDKTTSIAKAIGQYSHDATGGEGLSPKQIDFLIKSYTGVIGQLGIPLATPGGNPVSAVKQQFTADPLYSNQSTADFYDKLNKLSAIAVDKNIVENVPSKKITDEEDIKNSMQGISLAISRGIKKVNKINSGNDPDKEAKARAIKQKILELTTAAVAAKDKQTMERLEKKANIIFKKEK